MNKSTKQQTTLEVICVNCKKTHHITVPTEGYGAWRRREKPIQEALPDVSADDREMLMSGICPDCWNKLFG